MKLDDYECEGQEKYHCQNRPGCCKSCDSYEKCGHSCRVKCEMNQTYQLFEPYMKWAD